MLGIGTELPSCGKCKYFEVDETIDPNKHFGYCDADRDESVMQIVDAEAILTLSDFCSRFKIKD